MSNDYEVLRYETSVQAPMRQVYQAFTNATWLREWLCEIATVNPKPGGHIFLAWNNGYYTAGSFTELVKDQLVAFNWQGRGEPAPTWVRVSISAQNGGSRVVVEHGGIGSGEAWTAVNQEFRKGWDTSLENLVSVLDTGKDLRFVRRPMLGITLTDFNDEIARHLDVPVVKGIRLDGVVEGMGAETAGLQGNDVVVRIDGKDVIDWGTLLEALSGQHAGNVVEVSFYRGPELRTTQMKLSGRPLPELPTSIAELSAEVRRRYEKVEAEMYAFISTITEEEAEFKPEAGEWSAKQTLAHLILSERSYQNWIGEFVTGFESFYDDWGGNLDARVDAIIAVYPTLDEQWQAFLRTAAETLELYARLPEELLENKGTYFRIAYQALEDPYHPLTHLEQMQASVEACRQQMPA